MEALCTHTHTHTHTRTHTQAYSLNILLSKVELRKAEQPWQRLGDLQLELTEEQKETKEVFCKFQSILNKLTPQNYQKLVDMTLQLKINTEERLRGVVDRIFTKVGVDCSLAVKYTYPSLLYSHLKRPV